jgi:hypothetical protein
MEMVTAMMWAMATVRRLAGDEEGKGEGGKGDGDGGNGDGGKSNGNSSKGGGQAMAAVMTRVMVTATRVGGEQRQRR